MKGPKIVNYKYQDPQNPLIISAVRRMTKEQREDFEERAAIKEFDGCLSRWNAEYEAMLDIRREQALKSK